MDDIQRAQMEAGEQSVVERLRAKGLMPPETEDAGQVKHEALVDAMRKKGATPPRHDQRRELGLVVVCDACGSIVNAQWVAFNGRRQMVIVVEKCNCDSPLLKG